ncbi:G-protein coupled receptor 6-like [Patiria miniata]|uniref:G-protein coupled receptors family 1 profile domain-containing protein n=1 Tax=Patiria miniata TaxID=46514 RepID=A0A913ZUS1_PATMI|nr:G-protein coupled receptor 6-like [Patiria miniata]
MMESPYFTALSYLGPVCKGISITENLLVLVVLAGTKPLRARFYGFVFNLALADLVFSVFSVAFHYSPNRLTILLELSRTGYVVSILTILAVAVNRYLALSLVPAGRYDALLTPARLIGVCLSLWCGTLLVYVLPVFVTSDETRSVIKSLARPLGMIIIWGITAVLYCLAFRKIKRYAPPLSQSQGISPKSEQAETRVKQTRRLLVAFAFVLATSFVCWIPFSIGRLVRHFHPQLYSQNASFHAFYRTSTFLYSINPMINPMVYWWRLGEFREGFYALFCRCCVKTEHTEAEDTLEMEQTVAESADPTQKDE